MNENSGQNKNNYGNVKPDFTAAEMLRKIYALHSEIAKETSQMYSAYRRVEEVIERELGQIKQSKRNIRERQTALNDRISEFDRMLKVNRMI